jgi:fructose-specific phosphotransferase system IIA component
MLTLQEFMDENLIISDLKSKDKQSIIEEMVEKFIKKHIITDREAFLGAIRKREELESTAIGNGIAIPHARIQGVTKLQVALGKSENGFDFQSLDKKPVFIIFMIASPLDVRKEYLQIVAKIARFAKNEALRKAILQAKNTQQVWKVIKDFDNLLPEEIQVKTKGGRVIHRNG